MTDESLTYQKSGVDIDKANEANKLMKDHVKSTFTKEVLSDMGSFGGLFAASDLGVKEPVLVASTDGVGTKLNLAYKKEKFDTVGIDIVNHCVNDILVQGARPLFFLDYIGTSTLDPKVISEIIKGISIACKKNGCAILGGETAELPGLYKPKEFDLVGTLVGVVDKENILPKKLAVGNILIGLPSSGLHTNGYSLAQKIVFEKMGLSLDDTFPGLDKPVHEVLMEPHRSYLAQLTSLLKKNKINALAHLTGGGLTGNIPRVIPDGLCAEIDLSSWDVPVLFKTLQENGHVPKEDMLRTFNMGIGMVVIVEKTVADEVMQQFSEKEFPAVKIGKLISNDKKITYVNFK